MSKVSPFTVDIIYQGVNVGTSTNILSLSDTMSLDKIGSLSFTLPTMDEFNKYLVAGTSFNIYDEIDGNLGTYLFKSKTINDNNGQSVTSIECYDILKELTFETVGFNRVYDYEPVQDVITDLVTLMQGWSTNVSSDLGNTSIDFQGESIFRAVDEQRDRQVAHFRLGGYRLLEFGDFGDISDVYLTNVRGQLSPDYESNKSIGIVTSISVVTESDDIYNKVIPLGFGQGVSQLTIERANFGDYEVKIGTNKDNSKYYYIENDLSVSKYGRRTRVLSLPNLRALDNNDQNIINAANALKLTAETYMNRNLEPKTEYSVGIKALRKPVKVGQKILIDYTGITNNNRYVQIKDYFYVMDLTRNRSSDGNRDFTITISSVDDRRTSDQDVMIDVVRDLRSINVHIPATLSYFQNSDTSRIKGNVDDSLRVNAEFNVRMKEEILYLNRALLQFTTNALQTDATGVAAGGASIQTTTASGAHRHMIASYQSTNPDTFPNVAIYNVPTDAGALGSNTIGFKDTGAITDDIFTQEEVTAHSHDINIPPHTHDLVFGLFSDTIYPSNLGIIIDGVDYTNELLEQIDDTSFAPSEDQSYIYELDITSILNLNLKGNHTVEFYANSDTTGSIVVSINCLVTIQPINVSN